MSVGSSGGESCHSKANPTRGGEATEETTLEDHGVSEELSRWDWILPGLGESGPKCEADAVPPGNAICPTGDSVRYEPLRCRKVECPNCYKDEQVDRVFRIAVELEAYAIIHGERPHAVVASVPESEAREWTYDKLNTSLCRRAYRRMKRKCEIIGGYAVLHPWRLREGMKEKLGRYGYGPNGERGGYWQGVRDDAAEKGDPRKYAKLSPHLHNIGFPEWIEAHEGSDFLVRKYDELESLRAVVRHTRYLLSHRGVLDSEEVGRSVRPWGAFHHASDEWEGAEEELADDRYRRLCEQVADVLGYVWNKSEGLHRESEGECPECGTAVDKFHDLRELPDLVDGFAGMGEPWVEQLEKEQREFFSGLFDEWRDSLDDEGRGVELDGLDVPDSVSVWSVQSDGGLEVDTEEKEQVAEPCEPVETDGEMSQRKRRALLRQKALGRGAPREELIEAVDAPDEKLENDIEAMLRSGKLIDGGLGRIKRGS